MARKKTDTKLAVDNWAKGNQETAHHRKAIQLVNEHNELIKGKKIHAEKVECGIRLVRLHYTDK